MDNRSIQSTTKVCPQISQNEGSAESKCKAHPAAARAICNHLTVQESAVMGLLARGMRYKEIADELRISYAKVHKLQHKSYIKLQATNVAEAVTKWARLERGP